jgi:hypothetical protein
MTARSRTSTPHSRKMTQGNEYQEKPHERYLLLPDTTEIEEKAHKEHIAYVRTPPRAAHACRTADPATRLTYPAVCRSRSSTRMSNL